MAGTPVYAVDTATGSAGPAVVTAPTPTQTAGETASVASGDSGTSSILSVTAAKAKGLKTKLKSKLHHHKDHDGVLDEDGEDDDDLLEHDDAGATGTAVQPLTPAQIYANNVENANTDGTPPAVNGATTPLGTVVPLSGLSKMQSRERPASISAGSGAAANNNNNTKSPGGLSDAASIRSANLPPSESDWRRKAEFYNLFDEIGDDEELVSDFSAAWAKDILRHGRIYVGADNLAFICTILGLKCHCVLSYKDITQIEKANTARVIPNAINVTLKAGLQYLFTSFISRDHAFDIIVDCWKAANPEAYEAMVATQVNSMEAAIEAGSPESPFPNETSASVPPAASSSTKEIHPATKCSGSHFKETVLDVRFPSEPEKIFKLLYKDDEFMKRICEAQKLTDLKLGGWSEAGGKKRSFSYIKPLSGSVGPSSTKCHISDEILAEDKEVAFEVLSVTKTPDVPSGGSFDVQTKTCLTWAGGVKGGCRMLATSDVVWTGRSMIKGIINSASIAGQRDYNKELAKAIREHIKAHPAEFGTDADSGDVDDEVAADSRKDTNTTTTTTDTAGASKEGAPADSFLGTVLGTGSGASGASASSLLPSGNSANAILAVSNVVLLVLLLISWFSSSSSKAVKVNKVIMNQAQELAAMQRLTQLEGAWAAFRQCVDKLAEAQAPT